MEIDAALCFREVVSIVNECREELGIFSLSDRSPSRDKARVRVSEASTLDVLACLVLPVLSVFYSAFSAFAEVSSTAVSFAVVVACLLLGLLRNGSYRYPKWSFAMVFALGVLFCVHVALGASFADEVQPLVMVSFVFIVAPALSAAGRKLFFLTVIACSLVLACNALAEVGTYADLGYRLYNVRQDTLADKPMFTLLFALASLVLLIYLMMARPCLAMRLASVAVVAMLAVVGSFIIESKTLLPVIVATCCISVLVLANPGNRAKACLAFVCAAGVAVMIVLLKPDMLPGSTLSLIDHYFGIHLADYASVYLGTYSAREAITAAAVSLFIENPVFGSGFGSFEAFTGGILNWQYASETESSWLSFLAEGGLLFFCIQLALVLYLALRLAKCYKRDKDAESALLFSLVVAMALLNVVNDFAVNFYWCLLAVCMSRIVKRGGQDVSGQEQDGADARLWHGGRYE